VIQQSHSWEYIQRNETPVTPEALGTPMFIAALFTIAKLWKQPNAPLATNGLRKCGIYTQWNFMQP
jgi:hypothetical protein